MQSVHNRLYLLPFNDIHRDRKTLIPGVTPCPAIRKGALSLAEKSALLWSYIQLLKYPSAA